MPRLTAAMILSGSQSDEDVEVTGSIGHRQTSKDRLITMNRTRRSPEMSGSDPALRSVGEARRIAYAR